MSSIHLLKQVFRKEKENIFLQKRRKVEEKRDQKKYTLVKYLKCVLKRCTYFPKTVFTGST